jgi:hypothetical protein
MLNNDAFLPNLMLKNLLKEGQKNFQDGFYSRSIKYYTKVVFFIYIQINLPKFYSVIQDSKSKSWS